jgi:iron complex outermembrane recepter protein
MSYVQTGPRGCRAWAAGTAAIALTIALVPLAAQAQQAVPQEEIIVTGSRIARPNLTQPNPVQVMNAETIQSLGLSTTADIMNQLPQTQNNMTLSSSNRWINGAGVSFTNLRGLGEYRTLTLVDGKRHVGSLSGRKGSGGTSLVDLNSIAPSLIDRVEVVTGGASAVYGADAVAGVVNVILKKNYEGAEISSQVKTSEHGGYHVFNTSGIFGTNIANGRGNITFGFDYNVDKGLAGRDRDFATQNISLLPNPASHGSSDGVPDRITVRPTLSTIFAASGAPVIKTALGGIGSQYTWAFRPDGSGVVRFNRGAMLNRPTDDVSVGDGTALGGDGADTSQFLQLRAPNNRVVANTLINYQIAENLGFVKTVNFFADVKYANSRGATGSTPFTNGSGTAPTGNGIDGRSGSGSLVARADNPFLPADARALLAGAGITGAGTFQFTRLNDDWAGKREYKYEYNVFRAVTGFNGDLQNGWKYEAYYDYGRNQSQLTNRDRITARLNQQIDAMVDPATGQIVCRDATARALGCVPINPFKVGPLSPAQYAYAHTSTKEAATLVQESAGANLTGDLLTYRTPFSGSSAPLSFAAGVEWRREFSTDSTDWLAQQGSGFIYGNQNPGGPLDASMISREAFVEVGVPVLRDLPFAKAVDLDLAYRYSKYSISGSVNTWNARAAWAVNDDVKVRGGVARAVRAPNLDDLLSPAGDDFKAISDVCSVDNINAKPNRAANCRARGVPAGYDSRNFSQPPIKTGGNPALKPEIGNSVTAGVVFTPTFVPGLNVTADYWWFRITKGHAALDPNSLLRGCYDSGNAPACSLITRRADGSIQYINGSTANLGTEIVRGVDLGVSYSFGLDRVGLKNYGDLTLGFDGTWMPENIVIQDPADLSSKLYRAGAVGYPHLKGTFRAVWDWNGLTVTWQSRFLGESEMFPNASAEVADFSTVPTQWYHDLSAKYRWRNLTFFGGINNIADKKPPQLPFLYQGSYQGGAYATFPVTGGEGASYDVIGRAFFAGATIKF